MSECITVVVVDDSADIVSLYQAFLADEPDMRCVGAVTTTRELLDVVRNRLPDVVLLDLSMPGLSPLEVCREIQDCCPGVRVVFFSGYDDEDTVAAVLDAGAWGLLSKHADPDCILEGIRRVAHGDIVGLPTLQVDPDYPYAPAQNERDGEAPHNTDS